MAPDMVRRPENRTVRVWDKIHVGKLKKKPRLFHVKDSKVRNKNNTSFQKVFVT